MFFENLAQVTECLSNGQGIGVLVPKSHSGHSPRLDVGVEITPGDDQDHPAAKGTMVLVLSAVVLGRSIMPRLSRALIKRLGKSGAAWQLPWVHPSSAI